MAQPNPSINMIFDVLRNISLKSPKKSRILIYDDINSEVLKKYVVYDLDYSILYARQEKYLISPSIAAKLVKYLVSIKLFEGNFVSKLYRAYLLSYIEYVDPKVVITTIDNNPMYYYISNYFPDIRFYAIQNGARSRQDWCGIQNRLAPFGNSFNVILICFGHKEELSWLNSNICLKSIIPAGSLKESVYRSIFSKNTDNYDSYDICLVSQYRKQIISENSYPEILSGLNKLNHLLKKLIAETGYKLCVARCSNDEDEVKYFKEFFGDYISFITYRPELFTTYSAMDSSKLIVAFHSTCGFEAMGLGKKVLFCGPNSLKSILFGNLEVPLSFVSNDDYEIFKNKIIEMINMDHDTYLNELEHRGIKSYLMNNNEDLPLHIYLRDSIQELIK